MMEDAASGDLPNVFLSNSCPGFTDPIAGGIEEYGFESPEDSTRQTFLLKDFRAPGASAAPLLVLALHGALNHQQSPMTAKSYENAFGRFGAELARQQAIYISPEYRGGSWMGPRAESDVSLIIRYAARRFNPEKVFLCGGSMGGTSALIFAGRNPSLVDGVIALCPATEVALMYDAFADQFDHSYGGSPKEVPEVYQERSALKLAENLAELPLVLVHGTADKTIPVFHSRRLMEELIRLKANVRYIEIENGDHDAPIKAPPLADHLAFLLSSTNGAAK